MTVETTTKLTELVSTSPADTGEPRREGAAHIRLLKSVLKTSFPNLNAPMTLTPAVLNAVPDRLTTAEANITSILIGGKTFTGNLLVEKDQAELRLKQASNTFYAMRQASGGNVGYLEQVFPGGSSNIDVDARPTDGISASRLRLFRNTVTTGICGLFFFKGDGTDTLLNSFQTNSAKDGLNATGKFNFFEAPTSQGAAAVDQSLMTKAQVQTEIKKNDFIAADNPMTSGTHVYTHNLGTTPREVRVQFKCIEADLLHAVGDTVYDFNYQSIADDDDGLTVVANATVIKVLFKTLRFLQPDLVGPDTINTAKWTYTVKAWR